MAWSVTARRSPIALGIIVVVHPEGNKSMILCLGSCTLDNLNLELQPKTTCETWIVPDECTCKGGRRDD